jgi:hypothetical protein
MKIPNSGKIISIAMIIGIMVCLYIVYKILNAFGLLKTASEKAADAAKAAAVSALRVDQYFNPDYFQTVNTDYNGLSVDDATKYAKDIRSAMVGIGVDEEKIYTIFGALPSKVAISEIADRYREQYGFPWYILSDDMKADILNYFNADKVNTLMQMIELLPDL